MRDESEDLRRVGRDEMNLCEFPIALLTDYPSEGEDRRSEHRRRPRQSVQCRNPRVGLGPDYQN